MAEYFTGTIDAFLCRPPPPPALGPPPSEKEKMMMWSIKWIAVSLKDPNKWLMAPSDGQQNSYFSGHSTEDVCPGISQRDYKGFDSFPTETGHRKRTEEVIHPRIIQILLSFLNSSRRSGLSAQSNNGRDLSKLMIYSFDLKKSGEYFLHFPPEHEMQVIISCICNSTTDQVIDISSFGVGGWCNTNPN